MSSHSQTTLNIPTPPSSILYECAVNTAGILFLISFVSLVGFILARASTLALRVTITPEFHVFSLSISYLKISQQQFDRLFSANWALGFSVKNPDSQFTILYEVIEVAVCYGNVSLSSTSFYHFYQDENDQSFMNTSMGASELLVDKAVARDIALGWKMGEVNFTVTMDGKLRIFDRFKHKSQNLTVRCEDLSVGTLSNTTTEGSLIGGPRNCSVHVK